MGIVDRASGWQRNAARGEIGQVPNIGGAFQTKQAGEPQRRLCFTRHNVKEHQMTDSPATRKPEPENITVNVVADAAVGEAVLGVMALLPVSLFTGQGDDRLYAKPFNDDLRWARKGNTSTGEAVRRKVSGKARRCLSLPPIFGVTHTLHQAAA